jgi:hypothetical protein
MNNGFENCPALMSSGTFVTSWVSNRDLNNAIVKGNDIKSSHQYRSFLQKNASEIIKKETVKQKKQYSCDTKEVCGKARKLTKCGCE